MGLSKERPTLVAFYIYPVRRKMAYTLDTTVGEILKDTHAIEVLERHAPGLSKNPMIGLAQGMTLKSLLAVPQAKQAGLTEEMVTKVLAEINARK
jgi:hypothetical protein